MRFLILLSLTCNVDALRLPPNVQALDANEREVAVDANVNVQEVDTFVDAPLRNLVIMTEINTNYIKAGLFQNWMHYAAPYLNSSMSIVFDAPETEVVEQIEKMTLPFAPQYLDDNFHVRGLNSKSHPKKDPVRFGTSKYKKLMNRRPTAIEKLLQKGVSVLLVDLDTVWAKDPFAQLNAAGLHDLLVTDDGGGHFCGCFLFFRPTPEGIRASQRWVHAVKSDALGNQQTLNGILKHGKGKLDFKVLPHDQFPPGNVADKFKDATVYHANWMIGSPNKVKFFKKRNMWYNATELQEYNLEHQSKK